MTRKSTPKFEAYHTQAGIVVLTSVSKTEATKFAREMNKGSKRKYVQVRPVKKPGA